MIPPPLLKARVVYIPRDRRLAFLEWIMGACWDELWECSITLVPAIGSDVSRRLGLDAENMIIISNYFPSALMRDYIVS